MAEPEEYLQPDFNPSTYKVAQLRNVLLQNDVSYPSHAKKNDLIKLFNDHVKPTAAKKLSELNSVIANDDGIEHVETKKKKKSHSEVPADQATDEGELKVEKKRKSKKRDESPEKSPRKSSRSSKKEDYEVKSPKKRVSSGKESSASTVLHKVPILEASAPSVRERSPKRKSRENEDSKRERSPRRRERSPSKKSSEESPLKKYIEKSPSKKEKKVSVQDDNDDENIEILDKEQFDRTPFKVDKLDSSFSNDNIFQSSPDPPIKSIPRKRGADEAEKSPRKSTKSTRKTAFSSSPEQGHKRAKSPVKKSLNISKFEDDTTSPPSKFLKKELDKHDIFGRIDDDLNSNIDFFSNVTEKSPKEEIILVPEPVNEFSSSIDTKAPTPIKETKPIEDFQTPFEGNVSAFTDYSSAEPTPAKIETPSKRRYLIPDFSRFNVSANFAKKLGIFKTEEAPQEAKSEEEEKVPEDPELLEDEDEEEEEEEEKNTTLRSDDSVLKTLQKDVEEANDILLEETHEAVKQINEIFNDNKEEILEESEPEPVKERKPINFAPFFHFFKQLTVFLLFVMITFAGLWYREQRVLIGYCGSEIDQPTFPNTDNQYLIQADEILQQLKPKCLPCPSNAICLPSLQIKCKQDFIVSEPWYKLYGVLPFSNLCVEDREKENILHEVISKSLDLLRTRNANIKCGDGEDSEVGISDAELYEFFFSSKNPSISDEEFNELWPRVLEDLEDEPEISLRYEPSDNTGSSADDLSSDETEEKKDISSDEKIIFRSHSTAKLSIKCKFQKEIYEKFKQYKFYIVGFVVGLIIQISVYFKYVSYKAKQSKIEEITAIVITKLIKQSKLAINDSTGLTQRYLNSIQLRDELLTSNTRFQLWTSILANLDRNSNVRQSTKEIHGEIVRVLEWIGD